MDQEHNYQYPLTIKQPKPRKKWPFILLGIIVFIAAIVGTVISLKAFGPDTANNQAVAPTINKGIAPLELIDKVSKNKVITESKNYTLSRGSVAQNNADPTINPVIFPVDGYSYLTGVTTTTGLRFTVATDKVASDKDSIETAVTNTLTKNGFTKVDQDTAMLSSYPYLTFDSQESVCQIIDYNKTNSAELALSLVCLSKADLKTAYDNIAKLVALTKSDITTNATAISKQTITKDSKELVSLTVQQKDTVGSAQYYFATLDTSKADAFEYLGTKRTPSVDDKDSFVVPEALKAAIADPKWGPFLTDNIN